MLGEKQVVRALLQQEDIDVTCRDDRGRTAAHLAAELRNSAIMQILHESGRFDLNAKDEKGETPLDIANMKVCSEVITYLSEILNIGNDEEEDENDNEIDTSGGKPVLLDNPYKIFFSPEEDEYDINEKIKFLKNMPHRTFYNNKNEDGDDNNYSLNDTEDFLNAEKRSNELDGKYKRKTGNQANNDEEDEIDEDDDDDDVGDNEKPRRAIQFIDLGTEEEEKTIDDLMNSYDPDDNDKFIKNDSNEFDGSNEFIVLNDPSDDKNVSSSNDLEPKIDSLVDQDVEGRQNVELLEAERLIAITADDDENSLEKTEDFIEDEDITNSIDGQQNKESNSASNSNSNSQSQSTSFNVSQTESQSQSQSQEGENSYVQNDADQDQQIDNDNQNYVADHFDEDEININMDDEYNDNADDNINIDEIQNSVQPDEKEKTEKNDEQQTDK